MRIIIAIIFLGLTVSAFYLAKENIQLRDEIEGFQELIKNYDMRLTECD